MNNQLQEHEATRFIPQMIDDEFDSLKEGIRRNGLLEPIHLWESRILDGRHRYRACFELGLPASAEELSELPCSCPYLHVVSANCHRRHLTTAQRALIATDLADKLPVQRGRPSKDRHQAEIPGNRAERAAEAVGVSPRSVERALAIKKRASERIRTALQSGEISLSEAERRAKLSPQQDNDADKDATRSTPRSRKRRTPASNSFSHLIETIAAAIRAFEAKHGSIVEMEGTDTRAWDSDRSPELADTSEEPGAKLMCAARELDEQA